AHQVTCILKAGDPGGIPVKSALGNVATDVRRIGVTSLDAEIELRNPGKSGNIDSRQPGRNVGSKDWRDFVVLGSTLSIERRPVPHSWNPVTEIQTGTARSWFVR